MTAPTVEELAWMICGHLDADDPEVNPPTESDYELAQRIRNRIDNGIYLDREGERMHGYHTLARRITWFAVFAFLVVVLTLTHPWSAS